MRSCLGTAFSANPTHPHYSIPLADDVDERYRSGECRVIYQRSDAPPPTPLEGNGNPIQQQPGKRRGAPAGIIKPLVERACEKCGVICRTAESPWCPKCQIARQRERQAKWMERKRGKG